MQYNGELITVESGQEEEFHGVTKREVIGMVNQLQDGDSLVINATA